jgi:hypothetical protein
MAQPTGLPSGAALAETIWGRLRTAFPILDGVDASDLTAVADAVATLPGGEDALRETAARSAEFRTARPSYGHQVIAHLLLEGVVDVLTTNWDDCIERGGVPERLHAVTDIHSLSRITPPAVLKVHGCASEPASLLVTTEQLTNPPRWAREQTQARLGSAVVVFLGIGDVAGYVKQRIEEAIYDVGDLANIRVVSPSVVERWEGSQWAAVAPGLASEHRIAAAADQFMDELGAAYVHVTLSTHLTALSQDPEVARSIHASVAALLATDSLAVLTWARRAAVAPQQGESILRSDTMAAALTALGHLAGTSITFTRNRTFATADGCVEILLATQTMPARRMEQEAENRLADYASRGEDAPRFLVAGGIGWTNRIAPLPQNVLNESDAVDIVDGPQSLVPEIMLAHEVLAR